MYKIFAYTLLEFMNSVFVWTYVALDAEIAKQCLSWQFIFQKADIEGQTRSEEQGGGGGGGGGKKRKRSKLKKRGEVEEYSEEG